MRHLLSFVLVFVAAAMLLGGCSSDYKPDREGVVWATCHQYLDGDTFLCNAAFRVFPGTGYDSVLQEFDGDYMMAMRDGEKVKDIGWAIQTTTSGKQQVTIIPHYGNNKVPNIQDGDFTMCCYIFGLSDPYQLKTYSKKYSQWVTVDFYFDWHDVVFGKGWHRVY